MAVKIEKLGEVVRFHRMRSGLSQAQLADHAGVGKTVVFDVEHGKTSVRLETVMKILHVLNIQMDMQSPIMSELA